VKFLEREEEEQIRWGTELSDAVEEFRQGPCKLAGGGRRLPRSHLGHRRLEGERNRHWSERVFEVMPYIAKLDTSDISNTARGGGVRQSETSQFTIVRSEISNLIGHQNIHIL
jgi:hypothetical protein